MNNLNLVEFSDLQLNQLNSIEFRDLPAGEKVFFPEFEGSAYDGTQRILNFSKHFQLPVLGIEDKETSSISVSTANLTGQTQVLKISQKVLAERMHFTPERLKEVMQKGILISCIDDLIQKEEEAIEHWTEKAEGIEETFQDTQERDDLIKQVKDAIVQLVVVASSVNSLKIVHGIEFINLIKEDSLKFRLIRVMTPIDKGGRGLAWRVWSYFDKTMLVLKIPLEGRRKALESEVVHLRKINKDQPFGSHILGIQRQCSRLLLSDPKGTSGVGMLMPYYNCKSLSDTLKGYENYLKNIDDNYTAIFSQIDLKSWRQNIGYQLLLGAKYLIDRQVVYLDMSMENVFVLFNANDKDLEVDLADFGEVFFLQNYSREDHYSSICYKKHNTNRDEIEQLFGFLNQTKLKKAHEVFSAHLVFKLGIMFLRIFSNESRGWREFYPFVIDVDTGNWTGIRTGDLDSRLDAIHQPMKSLIDKMIAFDWTQRPTLEEVIMEYHQTVCKSFEKLQTKYASNIEALKAPSKDADDEKEKKE